MIVPRTSLLSTFARSTAFSRISRPSSVVPRLPGLGVREMSATAVRPDPFRPARRVAGQRQDVWYEAHDTNGIGQGFLKTELLGLLSMKQLPRLRFSQL